MKTPAHELSDRSPGSVRSPTRKRLRPSGGYRATASFQTATLIYDATYWFCEKFLDPRSRLTDQMLMAARSGRQNIAEGSRFSATSSQTELRLLNTARSSLEELLLDYEDFLFHRHLPQWSPESPEARAVRANAIICLIHQANYLLDQQLTALEQAFIEEGGYSEQLATARLKQRQSRRDPSDPSDQSDPSDPIPHCPQCGKPMVLRTAKTGPHAGHQFWGCTAYPDCKGTVEL